MLVCLVLGLPLAWLLARVDFRGRALVRALVTVPMVLPPVVAGVALRTAFGRTGLLGEPLLATDRLRVPVHPRRVVLAHVFVSMPFVVLASRAPCAPPARVRRGGGHPRRLPLDHVPPGHVPLALPGIVAGMVLGWARSLGEFGATITFNGNYPGTHPDDAA